MKGLEFFNKLFKFKYNFAPILYNKLVLYFICFLAIINVIYFTNVGDIQSLVIFVLVGILTSFFSKNMIVILVISLCTTHILKYGTGNRYEGLENKNDEDELNKLKIDEPLQNDSKNKKQTVTKSEVMDAYNEYSGVKDDIIEKIKSMEPMLEKVEGFIEKYETYKESIQKQK